MLHGDGAQRHIGRWLPDDAIAGDGRDGRVPTPNRNRKIEGADHADDAQGMPLFHHAVQRPLRGDDQAVELA